MFSWLNTLPIHTYSVREDGPTNKLSSCSELGLAAYSVSESLSAKPSINLTVKSDSTTAKEDIGSDL